MSDMTGIILAAGKGSRMQPFSDVCPKSVLPIMGRPIVVHQLEMMHALGIRRVLIVVGHLGYQLVNAVARSSVAGDLQIDYVDQKQTLGIAHALGKLESRVDGCSLMFLGDIYFITDRLTEMIRIYEQGDVGAVLAAKVEPDPKAVSRNFAVYEDEKGFVNRVIEKPRHARTNLKGCGLYLFGPEVFDAIRHTPRTAMRDEYEITDSIQILINDSVGVKAARVIDDDLNLTVAADLLHINLSELRRAGLDHLVADHASVSDSVTLSQCCVGRNVRFEGPAKLQRCVVFDDVVIPPHTDRADAIFYEDHVLAC